MSPRNVRGGVFATTRAGMLKRVTVVAVAALGVAACGSGEDFSSKAEIVRTHTHLRAERRSVRPRCSQLIRLHWPEKLPPHYGRCVPCLLRRVGIPGCGNE